MVHLQDKKVGVVILTFNRLSLLKITLKKVLDQSFLPFEILVVDNKSNDGTREYLESLEDVNTIFLEENLGPAGGFHHGVKYYGQKKNVDYVWLMDDDFFPSKFCLEELVKNSDKSSIVFPYVREKDFKFRKQPGWWGVLIPMEIVNKVGYPMADLFFWAEDTEYLQHRIRDVYNFPSRWISSAKGVHFTKRVKNFRSSWRYYYEIRNMIYSRLYIRKRTPRRIYKIFRSWTFMLGGIIVKENKKFEKLKYFSIGTYHGVTKKMGKTLDPKAGFLNK